MNVEADLFLVFQGFNPSSTGDMSLAELMRWHTIAHERHNAAQEAMNNAG